MSPNYQHQYAPGAAARGDGGLVRFGAEGGVNRDHNGAYALAGKHWAGPTSATKK
eukprot:COSAG04_NODE_7802_length_1064_cov_3.708808_1_plen_54_part_10